MKFKYSYRKYKFIVILCRIIYALLFSVANLIFLREVDKYNYHIIPFTTYLISVIVILFVYTDEQVYERK